MDKKIRHVFITRLIPQAGLDILRSAGLILDIYEGDGPCPKEILWEKARFADAMISMLSDKIDADFLSAHPHLKMISNYAVGFNNIDLKKASELNIMITNTPDVLTDATAEIAFGLIIMSMRKFHEAHRQLIDGSFKSFNPLQFLGNSLTGKNLGIVGMGRIGKRVAEIGRDAFKMNILYTSVNSICDFGQKVELNTLLENADIISLHCPLTEKTKNLIGPNELAKLKKTAVLINTSRGEIVDQESLYNALKNNDFFGAGLDVTTPEPLPVDHPLHSLSNVYILPHIGSANIETRTKMSVLCAENIISLIKNERPKTLINTELLK
jgi:glyoxylate reductase